jgi:hypothetical protein
MDQKQVRKEEDGTSLIGPERNTFFSLSAHSPIHLFKKMMDDAQT